MYFQNKSILIVALIFQIISITSCSKKPDEKPNCADPLNSSKNKVNFTVEAVEDISYSRVVRFTYRIKVEKEVTDAEIRTICQKIISQEKRPYNAIAFFFYLPDSDIQGAYTAGQAEWTPFGKWTSAKEVETGDYSHHQLIVKSGNLLGKVPISSIVDLPIEQKKKIYYELVVLQDEGMDADESQKAIAQKYKITREQLSKISIEATINGWPLPPAK